MIPIDHCDWNSPGADRYTGTPAAAIVHYTDIPKPIQQRLIARIERHEFDDLAAITRDSIKGHADYSGLRSMHFGVGKVCTTVDRSKWAASAIERGMVYCEGDTCVIVPTICGNISRITRLPAPRQEAGESPIEVTPGAGGSPGSVWVPYVMAPPQQEPLIPELVPVPHVIAADAEMPALMSEPIPTYSALIVFVPCLMPPIHCVPEPAMWLLFLAGYLAICIRAKRMNA